MLLALTIVAFVVIIARYVPWVNLLCFTEAIYHVVNIFDETTEAPLIIAVSKPSYSALPGETQWAYSVQLANLTHGVHCDGQQQAGRGEGVEGTGVEWRGGEGRGGQGRAGCQTA